MIISPQELFDITVITLAVGFIFKDFFKGAYSTSGERGFQWNDFWFAVAITAPAIVLHEVGHKIAALFFGMNPVLHASYGFLALGIILKMINFGFIFFVPGYVSHIASSIPWHNSLVAFAGPFVNLILLGTAVIIYKNNIGGSKWYKIAYLTAKINMFLFIFNMLPIPPFDGYTVFSGLAKLIF